MADDPLSRLGDPALARELAATNPPPDADYLSVPPISAAREADAAWRVFAENAINGDPNKVMLTAPVSFVNDVVALATAASSEAALLTVADVLPQSLLSQLSAAAGQYPATATHTISISVTAPDQAAALAASRMLNALAVEFDVTAAAKTGGPAGGPTSVPPITILRIRAAAAAVTAPSRPRDPPQAPAGGVAGAPRLNPRRPPPPLAVVVRLRPPPPLAAVAQPSPLPLPPPPRAPPPGPPGY